MNIYVCICVSRLTMATVWLDNLQESVLSFYLSPGIKLFLKFGNKCVYLPSHLAILFFALNSVF